MSRSSCRDCGGRRLRPEALAVTVAGRSIDQLGRLSVTDLREVMAALGLSVKDRAIAGKVLQEIVDRLGFLHDVGVGYLSRSKF